MTNVIDFGQQLVETGDLDPVYIMLNIGNLSPEVTARWCLAYWMFYHTGVASRIAEHSGPYFWGQVRAALAEKWPRGTERRHFRGQNAEKSVNYLQQRFPEPEDACASLAGLKTWEELEDAAPLVDAVPFGHVSMRAQQWVGFGPWIAFKIADMIDVCVGIPVAFPRDSSVWYDEPIKGGVFAWLDKQRHGVPYNEYYDGLTRAQARERVDEMIPYLMQSFATTVGPDNRGVGVQELETILCKFKSYVNGHYPIGKDTREILHALNGWGNLATQLQTVLRDSTPKELHGGR